MRPLSGAEIARAARLACLVEAGVAKPGNVSPEAAFADTTYEDFAASAEAVAPVLADAGRAGVGETVLRAVRETRHRIGTNTNLGIVLLLAPLAKAAAGDGAAQGLRRAVARVLRELTIEDARLAYEAIRLASPGGMGRVDRHDIAGEPVTVTLREAMASARERDAVAREYATDFELTFTLGRPALCAAWETGAGLSDAVLGAFLTILAEVPDTLIARKKGMDTARHVSRRAAEVLAAGGGTPAAVRASATGRRALAALDTELRDPGHTLNPGTTADLVTASLFVFLTEDGRVDSVAECVADGQPLAAGHEDDTVTRGVEDPRR